MPACHVIRVFPNPSQAGTEFGSVQICFRRYLLSFVTLLVAVPRRNIAERIAWAGFDMLTSDNLIITAKIYAANTAKTTIFNSTLKPISLGAGTLYIAVQKRAPWLNRQ
jgi:hypothetical protein